VRIAIVTETWTPSTDGVVTRLTATVAELGRLGHRVLVIAPGAADNPSRHDCFPGALVYRAPTFHLGFVYGGHPWGLPAPRLARWLREFQPDVVHVVNPISLGVAGTIAARRAGLPIVASYHTDVARYAGYYHLGWARPAVWALLRWLHNQANLNLATAAHTCAELRAHRIDRVHLWQPGVDLAQFHPLRASTPPSPQGVVRTALYVGRLAQEKGLERLLPLARRGRDFRLVCVGDGPDRQRLVDMFSGTTATFPGVLHGPALADAYRAADVFVFPSTSDTLGLATLEALASGLPVVAADAPSSREALSGCPAARLFCPHRPDDLPNVVESLLSSESADRLAFFARRHVERWGWPAATEQLLGFYRRARRSQPDRRTIR
jgi:glycosyltransferase involved in cell wall biosynthesis